MKICLINYRSLIFCSLLMTSCVSTKYFQVFETTPSSSEAVVSEKVKFEDGQLSFIYDFWSNKGDFGFRVWNRSDSAAVIDLENTFYIRNDFAQPYYTDMEMTYSTGSSAAARVQNNYFNPFYNPYNLYSSAVTAETGSSSSISRSHQRGKHVTVPARAYIEIQGFSIVQGYNGICNLESYPARKETSLKVFSEADSPIKITNRIAYRSKGEMKTVEHTFYVSKITNMRESEALTTLNTDDCGNRLYAPKTVFAVGSPKSFYIPYSLGR